MKSGVAAFAAAAVDFVADTPPDGAVILAITGDEEGDGTDGTRAMLDWMAADRRARWIACLVGEPTCPAEMGEMIKIGRRGSMTAWFTATGLQGHSAYPHRRVEPAPGDGAAGRPPDRAPTWTRAPRISIPRRSQVTTFDTGNAANNVIPAACRATVNIRFNDAHTGESLTDWLRSRGGRRGARDRRRRRPDVRVSGESFLTPPGALSDLVARAVEAETGRTPVSPPSGGTSDARFVKDHCPVVEFGLVGRPCTRSTSVWSSRRSTS